MYSKPFLSIDTETTGVSDKACPFAFSTCDHEGNTNYWRFDVEPYSRKVIYNRKEVKRFVQYVQGFRELVFHNASFDIRMLLKVPGVPKDLFNAPRVIHDTWVLSHLFDSKTEHGLKPLCMLYFDIRDDDEAELRKATTRMRTKAKKEGIPRSSKVAADYWMVGHYGDDSLCKKYAVLDAVRTSHLMHFLHPRVVDEMGLGEIYKREQKLQPVLRDTMDAGLTVIPRKFRIVQRRVNTLARVAENTLKRIATKYDMPEDYNPGSDKQLRELLIEKWKLPILEVTAKSGEASMKAEVIKEYASMLNDDLWVMYGAPEGAKADAKRYINTHLEYKTSGKVNSTLNTYSNLMGEGWVLRPSLRQVGTGTTRLASREPNGQNIPKGKEVLDVNGNLLEVEFSLREVFGPRKGEVWYAFDYSQLQLRIFSYESMERQLIEAFARGEDFHHFVATRIFNTDNPTKEQRRIAKNTNFALIFGAGKRKVDATAGMDGAYDLFRDRFPSVDAFMRDVVRYARKHGYIYTKFGYKLTVPPDKPYKAANYIVQGDEGDIVKNAMIDCHDFFHKEGISATSSIERQRKNMPLDGAEIIMQVHDELLFRAPIDMEFPVEQIKEIMEYQGERLGMVTPVDGAIIRHNWGKEESLQIAA